MPNLQQRMLIAFPEPHPRGLKAEIARVCQVQPPSVTSWFNNPGKVESIDRECAERLIAHYGLNLSARWLATGDGDMTPNGATLNMPAMQVSGGDLPAEKAISLRDAIQVLGKVLEGHDEMDREAAAIFLRKLTMNPKLADEVADKMEGLLGGGGANQPVFSRKTA